VAALAAAQDDCFGDEFVGVGFEAREDGGHVVAGCGGLVAAEELQEAQTAGPPFGVEGVVGYEFAVGGFGGDEGAVGFVGLEEDAAGWGRGGKFGDDDVEVEGYELVDVLCVLYLSLAYHSLD
jgi:hypothetical protein